MILAGVGFWGFLQFFGPKSHNDGRDFTTLESMEKDGVPNFEMTDLDGHKFDLDSLKGKTVILNFWASWCAPCIEEVPSLIKLVNEFKGDVQLLAVSGDSKREDIDVFLKSFPELKGANIRIIFDEDRSIMQRFAVARLPESLVLDSEHKLAKKIIGTIDWYTPESVEYVKTLKK